MNELKLQVERVLNSPRDVVFQTWASSDAIANWHCGSITSAVMQLKPGGAFRLDFEADKNCDVATVSGTYREVIPNERIVYSWKWNNAAWDSLVTVDFSDYEGGTLVQIQHDQLESAELVDGHREGWSNCLDGLRDYLLRTTDTLVPPC